MNPPPIGQLLREWRGLRRFSQLDLALESGISTRHLSCIETGKAQAGRGVLARIADVLAMPLRERNALLVAAGYAPQYAETTLDAPALDMMRRNVNMSDEFRQFEVNRYLGWPGQAPSYKVGQRIWEQVRDAVRAQEGDAFSFKDFHKRALDMGGVGLDTLRSVFHV